MPPKDLREHLKELDKLGELRTIAGVHWDLEMGCITDAMAHRKDAPAVLFDEIVGYPKGFRVVANLMGSTARASLCLGLPSNLSTLELVKAWREKLKGLKLIPAKVVSDGPVLENVYEEKEIDLLKFPVPRWYPLDGGRYIGTGGAIITRDPEEGWVNLGTYRVQVHGPATLGFYISPGKHGRIQREKYLARGQPCRVAMSFGHEPHLFVASSIEVPYGTCEYDFVGGLKGEPMEVIIGPYSGLPIPAHAEIVIEGDALFDEKMKEGPFGEWTGYYGSGARQEPIVKVKRLYHRNDPIIMGFCSGRPPSEGSRFNSLNRSAWIWEELEKAGVPDVKGVWCHPAGGGRLLTIVAIKQRYPGHAKQAGLVASACHAGAYTGRYVIVVDDDIDITDSDDLLWALATRSDPASSIDLVHRCWSTPLDPMVREGQPPLNSRAVIEACRPYEWKEEFPPVRAFPADQKEAAWKKWGSALSAVDEVSKPGRG